MLELMILINHQKMCVCIAFYTIFMLCTLTVELPLTCCLYFWCFFHRAQAGKTDELAASHKGVTFQADAGVLFVHM